MSDRTIDEINRDLSEVLDGLFALPPDAFAARYVLQERQRALRREAVHLRRRPRCRPTNRRAQEATGSAEDHLEALVGERINLVLHAGGGGRESNYGERA